MENVVELLVGHTELGDIRYSRIDGDVWMLGKDAASMLEYQDTKQAVKAHVSNENKLGRKFHAPGQNQSREGIFINEAGFYQLSMKSKKPNAVQLQNWISNEVLPSLRKEGQYDMNGESNSFFNAVDQLEDHAIKGNDREHLDHMMETYAKMAGISMNNAWKRFEGCYNRAYHTKIHVSKAAYEKKYNIGKKMSNPKYLEAVDKINKAIAVVDQMIKERYAMPIQEDIAYDEIQHQRDMEFSRNLYVEQFINNLNGYVYSMNYRKSIAIKMRNIPCVSFADIPREYRNFINTKYPFVADLRSAYQYAWNNAFAIYR